MIFLDKRVPASGPKNAQLAAIGMAPQKWELGYGIPFTGASGKIFNETLETAKYPRNTVYVTNLSQYYIDDNNLYTIPQEVMEKEIARVFTELETVKPNCLLIMGGDTLAFLTAKQIVTKTKKSVPTLIPIGGKQGITKWRGSIFELECPSGRLQKCVAAMHPANFIRGQWKWLPLFKYIDVPRAVTQSSFSEMRLTPRTKIVGLSFPMVRDYLLTANEQKSVTIDYEGRKHLTCLGVGWTRSEAMCIPLSRVGSSCYWSMEEEAEIWKLWCGLLQNSKVEKNAQNAPFEWLKSWLYGIYPFPLGIDTLKTHHCLYPDFGGTNDEWAQKKAKSVNPGHGLALITTQYTDQPFYKDDGRHWHPSMGERLFFEYNCLDVMVTHESAEKMKNELLKLGLWETYIHNYVDPFEEALVMEWDGIKFDTELRDKTRAERLATMAQLTEELSEKIGYRVIAKAEKKGQKPQKGVLNLSSSTQMQHFLYKERKYAVRKNRKSGNPTTNKDALHALAVKYNDPLLLKMLEIKKIQDEINDVLDQKLDERNYTHCHWKIGGTNGTRWSSTESILESGTNLQNQPRQGVARRLLLPG